MRQPNLLKLILYSFFICSITFAQYLPQVGYGKNDAIHKDSSIIKSWAKTCTVKRGWLNIQNKSLGLASAGVDSNAVGKAGGGSVVSLGDSGVAILSFNTPIKNGEGADFAIFENGFFQSGQEPLAFLEFAFVEVSSNGNDFYRFPSFSNIQNTNQSGSFDLSDASLVRNLAGKYIANYGTPFDLEELKTVSGLDVNRITHIKIVDVIGSINASYGTKDARGNIINDPFPTPFSSCGFDLDAVGVIHEAEATSVLNELDTNWQLFPNPVKNYQLLNLVSSESIYSIQLVDSKGLVQNLSFEKFDSFYKINLQEKTIGIYALSVKTESSQKHFKIVIHE